MSEQPETIATIPGDDGWWRSDGQETYEALAADLAAHGYSEADALNLLSSAYWAAAAEFGE